MVPDGDGTTPGPIDRPILERLRSQFDDRRTFTSAKIIEEGHLHLRVDVSDEYYPAAVSARFEIRWYRNDDFTIHYREERADSVWQCRWDRHPNTHNSREHFHPPPAARRTDAEDAQWPIDHRDVLGLVIDRLEERIETLWERQ
ncbi:MAG: hypothetical protein ABEI57_08550 [Halapricum sp.]